MDCKLLILIELLILKFEKYDKSLLDIVEKNQFYSSLGKFCIFYFNTKTFTNQEVETINYSKLIDLSNHFINNIMQIKDSFDQEIFNEYTLSFMKIILIIFQNTNIPNLFKLSASKLFNSILILNDADLLKKLLIQIKEILNFFLTNNNFEKFFTLYFTLLQYTSKKFQEIIPSSEENEEISLKNQNLKELIDLMLKFVIIFTTEILSKNNVNFLFI